MCLVVKDDNEVGRKKKKKKKKRKCDVGYNLADDSSGNKP